MVNVQRPLTYASIAHVLKFTITVVLKRDTHVRWQTGTYISEEAAASIITVDPEDAGSFQA
jgi:hypothetical protein